MPQTADILLHNARVLTMDEALNRYEPGAVAIRGESILAVGFEGEIMGEYSPVSTVDCGGKILMPGLVNAHTHAAMTLLRGLADEKPPRG